MKTTKRSKMLVSSIAMLLVALVVLGSATYAWYSINREVYADEVTIQAAAPDGIQIAPAADSVDNLWSGDSVTVADLALTDSVIPVKVTYPATGINEATTKDQLIASCQTGEADAATSATTSGELTTAAKTNVAFGTFAIRNTSEKNAATVSVTVNKVDSSDDYTGTYFNIAVFDLTSGTKIGAARSDGTSANSDVLVGTAFTNTITLPINKTPHVIAVVAYVDGENSNCYTNNYNDTEASFKIDFVST